MVPVCVNKYIMMNDTPRARYSIKDYKKSNFVYYLNTLTFE